MRYPPGRPVVGGEDADVERSDRLREVDQPLSLGMLASGLPFAEVRAYSALRGIRGTGPPAAKAQPLPVNATTGAPNHGLLPGRR